MDVALIERALKDADLILALFYDRAGLEEIIKAREQITTALIELRKMPTCEPADGEVEAAVKAYWHEAGNEERDNEEEPARFVEDAMRAALTAAALWRKEHEPKPEYSMDSPTPKQAEEMPEVNVANYILNAFRAGAEAMRDEAARMVGALKIQWPTCESATRQIVDAIRSLPLPTPKGEKT